MTKQLLVLLASVATPMSAMKVGTLFIYDDIEESRCVLVINLNKNLGPALKKRLSNHSMVDTIETAETASDDVHAAMRILLHKGIRVNDTIRDTTPFWNLLRNPSQPSKNAQRKLKNILHGFLQISTYLDDGRVKCAPDDVVPRFYYSGKFEHIFAPDFADYIASMESNMKKCAKIARIEYKDASA